jgi:hypothetical protein
MARRARRSRRADADDALTQVKRYRRRKANAGETLTHVKRSPLLACPAGIVLARHRACSGVYGLSALLRIASQSTKRKREQRCEYCGHVIPGGNLIRHCKSQHAGVAHADKSEEPHDGKVEELKSVSEWLKYCVLDLSASEVP